MELPDRANLEPQFADKIARLNGRQRQELEQYLTQTDPPSVVNVPPDAWDRWEREHRDMLLGLLLIAYLLSALHHGATDTNETQSMGLIWAFAQAAKVAAAWRKTGQDMLATVGADWEQQRQAWDAKVLDARKLANERYGIPGVIDFETGPLTRDVITELDLPLTPIPRQEVFDRSAQIFGPSRAEMEAVTEFTNAQSAGGEAGIEKSVGISEDDTWYTEHDKRVCPVCSKLHGKKRKVWSRLMVDGPPAHPNCRCWIVYANYEEAHGRLMPVGESFDELHSDLLHAHS